MAQQRKDHHLINPSILPSRYKGSMPWAVSCVASVADQSGALVNNWEVECFLQGAKVDTQNSVDGNVAFTLTGTKPGTYRIELRMLDSRGQLVSWTRDLVVEEEKHEKKHEEIHLRVHTQQEEEGVRVIVDVIDGDRHPLRHENVYVEIHHSNPDPKPQPTSGQPPFSFTTQHGSGSIVIPFGKVNDTPVTVQGAGRSYTIFVDTK